VPEAGSFTYFDRCGRQLQGNEKEGGEHETPKDAKSRTLVSRENMNARSVGGTNGWVKRSHRTADYAENADGNVKAAVSFLIIRGICVIRGSLCRETQFCR
jgi:hypothetical protein